MSNFPSHWGAPPMAMTRDLRPFPCGLGQGSGTTLNWIRKNMHEDALNNHPDRIKNPDGPWDELVGVPGILAKQLIEADSNGALEISILDEGSFVTSDYRLDRVRIYVLSDEVVSRVPKKG
mmetsp:Transcript_9681/g.14397  ORF Transcript_9681/g.14397 Transcript_9681/m.14397 type:complete len:121 (+) Transcript_9681:3-365(+)